MTNWGTMYNEILSNASRPSGDTEKIKRCIVDAIDAHRGDGFFFSEFDIHFRTFDGRSGYDETQVDLPGVTVVGTASFPKGIVEVIGELSLELGQDDTAMVQLCRVSWPTMLQLRAASPASGTTSAGRGQPTHWSWWNKKLEFYPVPDATVNNVRGTVYAAPGTIIKTYTGGAFAFYKPGTTTAMADNYPDGVTEFNAWFAEGYQMIRCYAEYLFYSQVIHAQDGRAEASLTSYLQARQALEQRAARLSTPRFIEPMRLDEGFGYGWR